MAPVKRPPNRATLISAKINVKSQCQVLDWQKLRPVNISMETMQWGALNNYKSFPQTLAWLIIIRFRLIQQSSSSSSLSADPTTSQNLFLFQTHSSDQHCIAFEHFKIRPFRNLVIPMFYAMQCSVLPGALAPKALGHLPFRDSLQFWVDTAARICGQN